MRQLAVHGTPEFWQRVAAGGQLSSLRGTKHLRHLHLDSELWSGWDRGAAGSRQQEGDAPAHLLSQDSGRASSSLASGFLSQKSLPCKTLGLGPQVDGQPFVGACSAGDTDSAQQLLQHLRALTFPWLPAGAAGDAGHAA